jgi:hypothetical protein
VGKRTTKEQFFVDSIIKDALSSSLADALVGTNEVPTGLSFGRKTSFVAVELAASPSVIFFWTR